MTVSLGQAIMRDVHHFSIDLSEEGRKVRAIRSRWSGEIWLNPVLTTPRGGFRQDNVTYQKQGDSWVTDRNERSLERWGISKSYSPGSREYKAFERLSQLSMWREN